MSVDFRLARVWTEEMDGPRSVDLPSVREMQGVMISGGMAGPGRVAMRADVLAETFGPDLTVTPAVVAGTECIVVHSGCMGAPVLRLADGLVVKGTTLITPLDGRSPGRVTRRLMDGLVGRRTELGMMWAVRA